MPTLNLESIDLTSTLRTAPLNGAPSSQDYNDSSREMLTDLAAIADEINNKLLPLINSLSAAALSPTTVGIEGRTVFGDTSDTSPLFFDSIQGLPLSMADSIRQINATVANLKQQLIDMSVQVASLQSKQASTSQSDIVLSVQSFSDSVNTISKQVQEQSRMLQEVQTSTPTSQVARVITPTIDSGATESVEVDWPIPLSSDGYLVSLALEDETGLLSIMSFSYIPTGLGIRVRVKNSDLTGSHTGYVHAAARPI